MVRTSLHNKSSSALVGHQLDQLNVIYNGVQALFKRTLISDQEMETVRQQFDNIYK